MSENTITTETNRLFRRVASFCGLRVSYYVTETAVALAFFLLILTENRTVSPLYIILSALLLPGLLKAMLYPDTPKTQKRENGTAFPLFCKKYHYDTRTHTSMNLAYLLLFIMLLAWRISYINSSRPEFIINLPVLIGCLSLFLRLAVTIGYQIYFRFFPLKAMR